MPGKGDLRVLAFYAAIGFILIATGDISADIPRKINYQGRIVDQATGEPKPGSHDMTFRIYDADEEGTLLWSEEQVATADSAGVLFAILGGDTAIDIPFDGPCWLEVEVDDEVLAPRREIVSVPFAFRALNSDSLGGLESSAFSLTGHSHDEAYVNEGEANSVTAAMVVPEIVSSIDGVKNDGGDIDLVAGSNITITPDDANDRITIAASGGGSGDITAVYADDGLSGGATTGDAHLSVNTGAGLEVSGDAIGMTSGYSTGSAYDSRFVNEAQANSVTAAMVVPNVVSSVDGVTNDGGNIDLIAGSNIAITPDDDNNRITIAASGVGDGHSLDAADGSPVDVVYVDNAGEVGIGTTLPASDLDIRGTLNVGIDGTGHDVNFFGTDTTHARMYWDASKSAFRAGTPEYESEWSDANTGEYSIAAGYGSKATEFASVALGSHAIANGHGAIAFGPAAATGFYSFAVGRLPHARGDYAFALGYLADASDDYSVAIGQYVTADADHSIVIGSGHSGFDDLVNDVPNSLVIGFDTTEPEFFVGGPDDRVGIRTDAPLTTVHVRGSDIDLASSALHVDVVAVEDENATLGLYSSEAGDGGSALTLSGTSGGSLVDKWGFVRETTSGGKGMRITYGTGKDQFINSIVMYLDDTGSVGIGVRPPAYKLDVAGSIHGSSFPVSSDARFKTDVRQLTGALARLEMIRGVSFDWNERYESLGRSTGHREIGVIAQEVEVAFPELVTTWGDGDYRAVDYSRMTAVLVEAIKELKAENEVLRERLGLIEAALSEED